MLAICEDCSKKYNIDETKIKGDRARFSCQECGHIIVVQKPKASVETQATGENNITIDDEEISSAAKNEESATTQMPGDSAAKAENKTTAEENIGTPRIKRKKGKGTSIGFHLIFALIISFASIAAAFGYLYWKYIPQLMNEQIDLRTSAITTVFSGAVKQPLMVRNYLQVNKETERVSKLPGVAYATVVNKRGIVVAGFFSDLSRFDQVFAAQVKASGFPRSIIEENVLQKGTDENSARFIIGGQKIQDRGIALPDTGGAVHVGIYISDIDQAIHNALLSPLSVALIGGIFFFGMLIFLLISRSISKPLVTLTDVVNRISLGELDLTIEPEGPSEVRELAAAFERMRYSIKTALDRMRKNT
jgi:HAMP domain-containing protein/DNA-directed RNA polymerase subunit RPC12/RpoP